MPNVYTPFNPRVRDTLPRVSVGSPFETEYTEYIDGFGAHKLAEKGKFDRVQYVNAQKDMCNLKLMIERYSLGDMNALNKASCFYADTTKLPQSLQDWSAMKKQMNKLFSDLPKKVQKKYGSPEKFVEAYGTDGFNEVFGVPAATTPVQSAPAVTTDTTTEVSE